MKLLPKARKVKFRLNIHSQEVTNLAELRDHFSFLEMMKLIQSGQFYRWLEYLGEEAVSLEIRETQENKGEPLAFIKLILGEYADCQSLEEVFFKEYHSKKIRPLLMELMSLIESDDRSFLERLISLNDKRLVNEWQKIHGLSSLDNDLVVKVKHLGIKKSLLSDSLRWEVPPSNYYPKDFSISGASFLSKIQSFDEQESQTNIPNWFKENCTRRDMWEFLLSNVRILKMLQYGGSYRKDKVILLGEQFLSTSNDNHFFTEKCFIGALIAKKYKGADPDFLKPDKVWSLASIKENYIPAQILYDHWDSPINNKVTFYSSVWYTDEAILKSDEFLKLSLGEQICLLISNLFNSSLYE